MVSIDEVLQAHQLADTTEVPVVGATRPGSTVRPDRNAGGQGHDEQRRRTGGVSRDGVLNVVGALAVSLCATVLLFGRLAPFSGLIGSIVVAYLIFLVSYAALVSVQDDASAVQDRLVTVILWSIASLLMLALVAITSFTAVRGWGAVRHLNFFTQDLSLAGPLQPLTIGGLQHAMVGTLWMISIGLVLTVPLGMACAIYLNESRTGFARFVRTIVEAMTALPSVVAGLFIYLVWELILHHGVSGFAAAMALSIMGLPIMIRAADVVLRLVPGNLKEASAALGAPAWRTMWHVVLPTARSGLATSVILGMARMLGETSPVLLTAGYTYSLNKNPFKGPMVSLPLAAYELVKSPQKSQVARGFGAALFLLALVVVLFVIARAIGGRGPGQLNSRQRARVQRQSTRDLARFRERAVASVPMAPADDPFPGTQSQGDPDATPS